jgi:hypothetical protein
VEEWPPIRTVAANILNKQSQTADNGALAAWVLVELLTTPHCKNLPYYEPFHKVLDLD